MTGECEPHRGETDPDWVDRRDRDQPPQLASAVVDPVDGPAQRTIYPPDVAPVVQMERWITARDQDFVDSGEWR
ncbi:MULTISPECIES: DUF7511 domain-containing protein [Natrinema]|uniref:DUF7511 domain-containing protein n=2 Tax=Natrinema TaxID=88723 RepID=M0C1P7_9EURY|nr:MULTISPECIES: hypothetical protein [Natrinema]ELZ17125.1 hypothetical protein C476_16350 [Natrinema limicola JCM 13563]RZV06076.1 hypothetical protein BDK88_4031 [Natrinema hispanicum]